MIKYLTPLLLSPLTVFASVSAATNTTQPSITETSSAGMVQWFASSFLVLFLIIGLAWALKKTRLVPNLGREDFKVIYTLPVGVKEKLLVVQTGSEQLLLGVTAQNISFLSKIDPPLTTQPQPSAFANQLARFLNKSNSPTGSENEK